MSDSSDEINLLLPLAFGLFVLLLLMVCSLICWLLLRFKIVEISDKQHLIKSLKGAFLSFIGIYAFIEILTGISFVINIIVSFFSK